jgi:starvation-inducible DNA-binding protein
MPKTSSNKVVDLSEKKQQGGRLFETRIGIDADKRKKLIAILNARLADTLDVQSQAKFAHWNVKGKDFYQVHLLFDAIAEHLEEGVDMIAERITALGGRANGTLREAASATSIPEYDTSAIASMDNVRALADSLGALSNGAREAIEQTDDLEDRATSDLFTEIVRTADSDLYFLESHLQV